jgi:hypothetical protein
MIFMVYGRKMGGSGIFSVFQRKSVLVSVLSLKLLGAQHYFITVHSIIFHGHNK